MISTTTGNGKPLEEPPPGGARLTTAAPEASWTHKCAHELGSTRVLGEELLNNDLMVSLEEYWDRPRGFYDRVMLGRLLARAMAVRGQCSKRQLATELGLPEGSLRTFLLYAQAAELRKLSAPETAESEVAALSPTQVRTFLQLPEAARHYWMDAGADLAAVITRAGHKELLTGPGERQEIYSPHPGALAGVGEQAPPITGARANDPPGGEQNAIQVRPLLEALARIERRLSQVEIDVRRLLIYRARGAC
jgi:hypothetical protein